MWINRYSKKLKFINDLLALDRQVLVLRGARQVGKTSFALNALEGLTEFPQLRLNFFYPGSFRLNGIDYLGRDFFGGEPTGQEFLQNIQRRLGNAAQGRKPAIVFIDEADSFPQVLEAIQSLAEFSDKLKIVLTGSNLENIAVKNAATGRKKYFDLYPITFTEFLEAAGDDSALRYFREISLNEKDHSAFYHDRLRELARIHTRIGGMPRVVAAHLGAGKSDSGQPIPEIIADLAVSIEENVKTVLGEKAKLYEYEDVLRKMAHLSMNTLKFTNLQVQHAGRSEAKKLVFKTVGARVAHKIRLFESESDLSKYILFDCGITHYLLSGSDLLGASVSERNMAILAETFVGTELIAQMTTRDDLFYWKSGNLAEVEFVLRSPAFAGIDVKSGRGNSKSLNSFALLEPDAQVLVKIADAVPRLDRKHTASLPNYGKKREIPCITIPHYLTPRIFGFLKDWK